MLFVLFFRFMRYGAVTNKMIHQVLLDPSGTEATFIYKNRFFRKLRSDDLENTVLIQSLVNPPQENEYTPLKGQLFPEEYPFNFEKISDFNYYWLKYYISQHMFFSFAKRPNYVNYEVMCNIFATKFNTTSKNSKNNLSTTGCSSVDFSQAKIYKIKSSEMGRFELEFMLESMNIYSRLNFANRKERSEKINQIISEAQDAQPKVEPIKGIKKNKTYERIMNEKK